MSLSNPIAEIIFPGGYDYIGTRVRCNRCRFPVNKTCGEFEFKSKTGSVLINFLFPFLFYELINKMEISRAYYTLQYCYVYIYIYTRCNKGRHHVYILWTGKCTPRVRTRVDMALKCSFPCNPTKYVRSTIKKDTVLLYSILFIYFFFFNVSNNKWRRCWASSADPNYAFYVTITSVNMYDCTNNTNHYRRVRYMYIIFVPTYL